MVNEINNIQPQASGNTIIIPTSTESIEVTKNSKGYNYVVKILGIDLDRLEKITKALDLMYKSKE